MGEPRHNSLSLLSPVMRAVALEFIAKLVEHDIAFKIIETWRTKTRHEELLAKGVSWTENSKHLRTRTNNDGLIIPASHAIDVCPWKIYDVAGADKLLWDGEDPLWDRVGTIGKSTGLAWGGDWRTRDCAHFEITGS